MYSKVWRTIQHWLLGTITLMNNEKFDKQYTVCDGF